MNINNATRMLKDNRADIVIAGGTESQITPLGIALFSALRALDRSEDPELASRPFHKEMAGFVMGEGAGALVLETLEHAEERGAKIIAELTGFAESSDAFHPTFPDGKGATAAMREALDNAEAPYGKANMYFNAHATGTGGDQIELEAILNAVKREQIAGISSSKSAVGHMMGAAGAFEALVCIEVIKRRQLPPNLKLNRLTDMVEIAQDLPINSSESKSFPNNNRIIAINNSFGFGGLNAAGVFM